MKSYVYLICYLQMILFFFCYTSVEHILHIRMLLTCFTAVTGLRINVRKSEIVPVGNVDNVDVLADILGCKVGILPMSYLVWHWELPISRPHIFFLISRSRPLFGVRFWRNWKDNWQDGRRGIYLWGVA